MSNRKKPNPHAQALGALGGKVGGKAKVAKGFAKMDPDKRSKIASAAAAAGWAKKRAAAAKKKGKK